MDSKPPLQGRPLRRKVHVVYYLSRGGAQMDHPHLLEGYLSAAQDGLRLRDFKRWLSVLRGKDMPNSFAWSYKRSYKNSFIWHDLGDNDLIQPISKTEYVLMGSEIKEHGLAVVKCKCGAIQQQSETKVVAEVPNLEPEHSLMSKPTAVVTRSPNPVTKSGSYIAEDNRSGGGLSPGIVSSPMSRLGLITTDKKFQDSSTMRTMNKSILYRGGGGSSRSFNDLTTQRLLEEVKKPAINHHDKKQLDVFKSFNGVSHTQQNSKVSVRDCEIIAEEDHDIDEAAKCQTINHGKSNRCCGCMRHATFTSKLRGDHCKDVENHYKSDGIISDDHDNEEDINGIFIMDAATQTGDSTRCSTEEHHDGITSADYNMLESLESPADSQKIRAARRVSSARYISNHSYDHNVNGSLSMHLSQDLPELHAVEKASMKNQEPSETHIMKNAGNVSSSNHTYLHNHMGSPGALSSCSAMSARSNTRFARQESNGTPLPGTSRKSGRNYNKPAEHHHDHHHQHQHHHSKGTSSQSSSGNIGTTTSSSTPHTLLKQLLTCGNTDVVTNKKPNSATDNVMVINNNALSGLQTPSRAMSKAVYTQEADKSKNGLWAVCKPAGLMKRMGGNTGPSSDNRSVISATATSEQGSMRDMLEMESSPESVSVRNHHIKSNMMKAHSLSASSAAAALQSDLRLSSGTHANSSVARRILQHLPTAVGPAAAGSTSPGVFSVASSTSRRSSMRDMEPTIMEEGDVEEGLHEALRGHHVEVKASTKSKASKGNKNTLLIPGNLEHKEATSVKEGLGTKTMNAPLESRTHPIIVSELHKLICNPNATPPCVNHNKVTHSVSRVPYEQACIHNYPHAYLQTDVNDSYTPQRLKPHEMLTIERVGHTRISPRSANVNSPSISMLSRSLISPSSSLILERRFQTSSVSSSPHTSSWKDILWSPRRNFSQKEKERRNMKP